MGFAVKLLLGGALASVIGVWWFIDGISGGLMEEVVGGMLWKGPLLSMAGVAAVVMGCRMIRWVKPEATRGEVAKEAAGEVAGGVIDLFK